MTGVIVNTIGVIAGACIGLVAKKIIPESWSDVIIKGIGLCTIYIGLSGALKGSNTLVLIISMVVGTAIGEGFRLEERFCTFAENIESHLSSRTDGNGFASAFVTSSLLMCVGAMAVVGSLDAGLRGDNTLLFTKTAMDFTSSMMLAATLGYGVIFSAIPIMIFQGSIALMAGWISPLLTDSVIAEMTCSGSILIMGLGLNLVVGTKLKVMNYMPALFLPIAIVPLYEYILAVLN